LSWLLAFSLGCGVTDVAGAATKTDVHEAQEALDATSNLPGLAVTAAGGNLKAGQTAATITDVASLAVNPKDAMRNTATVLDAGKTVVGAYQLVQDAWASIKDGAANVSQTWNSLLGAPGTP
jgi:succinyl-CoA synthetase beta subunit